MSRNVEISTDDWQRLVALQEKYGILMFEAVFLLQEVSYTSTIPRIANDAARLFRELQPFGKLMTAEDPPFGVQRRN
jgi:hypothetical protein